MFSRSISLRILILFLVISGCSSWFRRRRRRAPPPPPQDCVVSTWSSWSDCDGKCSIGTHTRYRSVITHPAYGGADCPTLSNTGQCGAANGGCSDICRDGKCSCQPGYTLLADQKTCGDIDECSAGTSACHNANCQNSPGSYSCHCLPGYQPKTGSTHHCTPKSCPALTIPQCPVGSYRDAFGVACKPIEIRYPDGKEFLKKATLTCPQNYKLAIIAQPASGKQFAEDFTTADFQTPNEQTTCVWDSSSAKVTWDWNPQKNPYYCRRVNDPPTDIILSSTRLNEKERVLTEVGTFAANDPQSDKLTYSIQNAEGNYYFLIQSNRLLVKRILVWSPNRTDANTRVVVVNATDYGAPPMHSQTVFNITILNINDPPYHLELSNTDISENSPKGTVLGNLSAIDDDVGPQRNSNFSWELVDSANGFFGLRGNQVYVTKPLNHEENDVHRITVRCSDFQEPRQTSAPVTFLINVLDENESPKSVNLTKTHVAENSIVGSIIGQIVAADDDNDTLSFDLNESDHKVIEKFKLDDTPRCTFKIRATGKKPVEVCSVDLIVNGSLDYEEQDEYVLWVGVSDPGGVTRMKFKIKIDDVNERPTEIILTSNHVLENSHSNTLVGEFIVTDPDDKRGPPQSHTCLLKNSLSGDEDTFIIGHTSGRNLLRVKTGKSLNFEKKNIYNITVTCTDNGKLGLTKSFHIKVTDVNENPTSLNLSNILIKENSPDFTLVGYLSAVDPEGDNQTFQYTISRSSYANFFIGGAFGNRVLVNCCIDYETTETIIVRIRVTDNGGLSFEHDFTLQVLDVNDPPTDIILQANSSLPENSAKNVFIGEISVLDQDKNTHGSCRLLNTSDDRVMLNNLNLLAGSTKTDYESLDFSKSLKILLNCSDGDGASITKWLTVPVEDVNEPPTGLELGRLEVRENQNESLVGILRIDDPDVNQRHNCTILKNPSHSEKMFFIDGSTIPPTLRTAKPLDFETSWEHSVDITCEDIVKDVKQLRYSIEKLFKIRVIDVNERPVIRCATPFLVSQTSSPGSVIGQIDGYDADNDKYYQSRRSGVTVDAPKQSLTYRFEPENNSWPFDITANGIIYLEKSLTGGYNGSIVSILVEDDGTLQELTNGSRLPQIKKNPPEQSVQKCKISVVSNLTYIDFHLSSNRVHENATNGTKIGQLSRRKTSPDETITYNVVHEGTPFEVKDQFLIVSSHNSLDYERLGAHKVLPVNVSSHSSVSGIFTKIFFIEIIDVNEKPTAICLLPPQTLDDCTVIGHILIEDADHPELRCGSKSPLYMKKVLEKLSEYTCHIDEAEDILSNEIKNQVYQQFSVDQKLALHVNKSILTQVGQTYAVPVVCRSNRSPLHVMSATFNVTLTAPVHATCRDPELCASCPQPTFCLSHVAATDRCVAEEFRIGSTVAIPGSYFEKDAFIFKFEKYVESLIEQTSGDKTLAQLMAEFDDENTVVSRRRRREAPSNVDDVYVELFIADGSEKQTNVVFAVARNLTFKLIPASAACNLLKTSEVKCPVNGNESPDTNVSDKGSSGGIPLWAIFAIIGVLVLFSAIILVIVVRKRNKPKKSDAVVHFVRDSDTTNVDSMYETPSDQIGQSLPARVDLPPSQDKYPDPVLMEKRKDIKVFNNPMYRRPVIVGGDDNSGDEGKTRTFNHYEQADPEPVYQTIDDDLYEKVAEERKPNRKKSRSNPVYNMEEDEDGDTLNPVVNLTTSPKKVKTSEDNSEVFEAGGRMSTFQSSNQEPTYANSKKDPGKVNPTYENAPTKYFDEENNLEESDDDSDTLNPIVNLPSHSNKVNGSWKSKDDESDPDDSWANDVLSTFKNNDRERILESSPKEDVGMPNPIYGLHVNDKEDNEGSQSPRSPIRATNELFEEHNKSQAIFREGSDENQSSC